MGPDFNNDGRVDGYDMEYLGGSGFGGCGAGCGEAFKLGCLIPVGLLRRGISCPNLPLLCMHGVLQHLIRRHDANG